MTSRPKIPIPGSKTTHGPLLQARSRGSQFHVCRVAPVLSIHQFPQMVQCVHSTRPGIITAKCNPARVKASIAHFCIEGAADIPSMDPIISGQQQNSGMQDVWMVLPAWVSSIILQVHTHCLYTTCHGSAMNIHRKDQVCLCMMLKDEGGWSKQPPPFSILPQMARLPSLAFSKTVLATMFSSSIDSLCLQGSNAAAPEAAGEGGRDGGRAGGGRGSEKKGSQEPRVHTTPHILCTGMGRWRWEQKRSG